jgi:hypothetical protein
MPVFPAGVVLMAAPSQVHSLGVPVTINGPVVSSEYGRGRLVDGASDHPCRMGWGTVQITLDLEQTRTPNIVGVLNHNIDFDRVIGVTNEAGLDRGFGARDPNCWIDLRGFPTTARYWTLAINSNSVPVSIGEIVIATGTVFRDGLWEGEPGFAEKLSYPGFRDETEYKKTYLSASGAVVRTAEPSLRMDEADRVKLRAITTEALGANRRRVLVVPSSRINDIWFCDWPSTEEATFENPMQRTGSLPFYEMVGSVLNGR